MGQVVIVILVLLALQFTPRIHNFGRHARINNSVVVVHILFRYLLTVEQFVLLIAILLLNSDLCLNLRVGFTELVAVFHHTTLRYGANAAFSWLRHIATMNNLNLKLIRLIITHSINAILIIRYMPEHITTIQNMNP